MNCQENNSDFVLAVCLSVCDSVLDCVSRKTDTNEATAHARTLSRAGSSLLTVLLESFRSCSRDDQTRITFRIYSHDGKEAKTDCLTTRSLCFFRFGFYVFFFFFERLPYVLSTAGRKAANRFPDR